MDFGLNTRKINLTEKSEKEKEKIEKEKKTTRKTDRGDWGMVKMYQKGQMITIGFAKNALLDKIWR